MTLFPALLPQAEPSTLLLCVFAAVLLLVCQRKDI
jgi:hypothetical protein